MIEFGKTLRLAREAKGYTISQLAEATHMIHQTIEDLENENFSRIAAPIYGRGFVKLYCEAVDLDPKPMIAEFMEIFSGNRELGIKERMVAPPTTTETDSIETIQEQEDASDSLESFVLPDPIAPEPPKSRITMPVQADLTSTKFGDDAATEEPKKQKISLSRYAAPLREASLPSIPPTVWRIAALAIGGILVFWLMMIGLKAHYKATSGAKDITPTPPESAETANTERAKVDVPPLYVD